MLDSSDEMLPLTLPEELILMLLNEETGFFHQVLGWELNCAVVGATLAELSLQLRIDTDLEKLLVVDETETGNPALDPILREIASEPEQRNARYWIERLTDHAEAIVERTLDRLVEVGILKHHEGEFWTFAPAKHRATAGAGSENATEGQFIKARIREVIFTDAIPDPRDVIVICLVNTCDVFRFIFELDEEAEGRIALICRMDLIGRSIAAAVEQNIANPMLRQSALAKKIPDVSLRRLLLNRHLRIGNIPALFADLAREYGPLFRISPPFKGPMIFLAGANTNRWVHRRGRMYLRTKDYFADFEKIYGANGVMPSLDGADHFRLRRSMAPAHSRDRLAEQMDQVFDYGRKFMSDLKVGESYPATRFSRRMINAQLSPLFVTVESQDLIDDLLVFKERALNTHIVRILPKFMLKTPRIRRKAKKIDTLISRIQKVHTPAQRAGCPRNLADDWLSLHASDPQLVPESNLRFALSAALVASAYLGDAFSFTLYGMVSQPECYRRIRREADALFEDGDPAGNDFTPEAIDYTRRFIMECLRMYPIVPMAMRDVMNSCMVEGYQLPVGTRLYVAQSATHYMEEHFPDPFKFDVDRYLPERNEHRSASYAPYGLGTHMCLGRRWMDLQLAVNLLMIAHYFDFTISPANYKLRFNPFPSLKPSSNLKFHISEKRREVPA